MANTQKRANINKVVMITGIAALLIVAGFCFYRLVIFPDQNQKNLGACVLKAKMNYDERWSTVCLSLFSADLIKQYGEDKLCESMAAEDADPIDQNYQRQIDDCVNGYPEKAGK